MKCTQTVMNMPLHVDRIWQIIMVCVTAADASFALACHARATDVPCRLSAAPDVTRRGLN